MASSGDLIVTGDEVPGMLTRFRTRPPPRGPRAGERFDIPLRECREVHRLEAGVRSCERPFAILLPDIALLPMSSSLPWAVPFSATLSSTDDFRHATISRFRACGASAVKRGSSISMRSRNSRRRGFYGRGGVRRAREAMQTFLIGFGGRLRANLRRWSTASCVVDVHCAYTFAAYSSAR